MGNEVEPAIDGRRARRERSRVAVVDAVFALIHDGKIPPTPEDIAELAGVSVSSVFRNFDGLDDVQRQAFDVFRHRYAHLLEPVIAADATRSERVAAHVKSRLALLSAAGPMMRVARHRALDSSAMAEGVARNRSQLSDQTRAHFSTESAQLTPAEASNLIALIDSMSSPEAFDVMRAAHARSDRQITRTWVRSIEAVLDGWPGLTYQSDTDDPDRKTKSDRENNA